jgi:hypothetical protein
MANTRVNFDINRIINRSNQTAENAVFLVTEQVRKDSNYYARQQTGELIRSSSRASEPYKGRIVWQTLYARKVYYTGTPRADVNPNAKKRWFEEAKRLHLREWVIIARRAFRRRE